MRWREAWNGNDTHLLSKITQVLSVILEKDHVSLLRTRLSSCLNDRKRYSKSETQQQHIISANAVILPRRKMIHGSKKPYLSSPSMPENLWVMEKQQSMYYTCKEMEDGST
jgi:hypothetical protein